MKHLGWLGIATILLGGACSSSKGSTGAGGSSGADGAAGAGGAAALAVKHPNPIISRAGHAFANIGDGSLVIDGVYHNGGWNAGTPTTANPSWVAIQMTAGPTRVLLSWDDGGTYPYDVYSDPTRTPLPQMLYGMPTEYHIDVSANSTNGSDGSWTTVVPTVENQVRTRAHSFDFTGKSWVKMVITGSPPETADGGVTEPNGVQIGEIDVHDLSATGSGLPDDTWFFMGDSITAFAYDRQLIHSPSFADTINMNAATSAFYPAMINGGIGGELSADGLARLAADLSLNPDYRFFLLGYGTNDSANDQTPVASYQSNMQMMIDMVKAAGRIPIIPHIPYAGDGSHGDIPSYNAAIDTLVQSNGLVTGPDFYTYFMTNAATAFTCGCANGRTTDNLHPNDAGLQEMNTLWVTAMLPLYQP